MFSLPFFLAFWLLGRGWKERGAGMARIARDRCYRMAQNQEEPHPLQVELPRSRRDRGN